MTQTFKVQGHGDPFGRTRKTGSELRFRGQWLKAAGFKPGDRVRVSVRNGWMELAVEPEPRLPDPVYVAAMAGFERIGL